jgi:hypothetical protein
MNEPQGKAAKMSKPNDKAMRLALPLAQAFSHAGRWSLGSMLDPKRKDKRSFFQRRFSPRRPVSAAPVLWV